MPGRIGARLSYRSRQRAMRRATSVAALTIPGEEGPGGRDARPMSSSSHRLSQTPTGTSRRMDPRVSPAARYPGTPPSRTESNFVSWRHGREEKPGIVRGDFGGRFLRATPQPFDDGDAASEVGTEVLEDSLRPRSRQSRLSSRQSRRGVDALPRQTSNHVIPSSHISHMFYHGPGEDPRQTAIEEVQRQRRNLQAGRGHGYVQIGGPKVQRIAGLLRAMVTLVVFAVPFGAASMISWDPQWMAYAIAGAVGFLLGVASWVGFSKCIAYTRKKHLRDLRHRELQLRRPSFRAAGLGREPVAADQVAPFNDDPSLADPSSRARRRPPPIVAVVVDDSDDEEPLVQPPTSLSPSSVSPTSLPMSPLVSARRQARARVRARAGSAPDASAAAAFDGDAVEFWTAALAHAETAVNNFARLIAADTVSQGRRRPHAEVEDTRQQFSFWESARDEARAQLAAARAAAAPESGRGAPSSTPPRRGATLGTVDENSPVGGPPGGSGGAPPPAREPHGGSFGAFSPSATAASLPTTPVRQRNNDVLLPPGGISRALFGSPGAASEATENYLDDTLNTTMARTIASPPGHRRSTSEPPPSSVRPARDSVKSLGGDECSICFNELYKEPCATCETKGLPVCVVAKGRCGHRFHRHCILEWLSTCDIEQNEMLCPYDKGPWDWLT